MAKNILEFDLDGKKVYFESEIPAAGGKFIAAETGKPVNAALDTFENAMEPVLVFVRNVVRKIDDIEIAKPTEIELEFGIKLTSSVNCWVISGTGEGTINLKLSWKTEK